jgi:hypothetical protein
MTETSYKATGLDNGVTGYYAVAAFNDTGESELSTTSIAMPEAVVWQELGGEGGISSGGGKYNSLYVYNGTPFIAYNDEALGGKATVMEYTPTGWRSVGQPGFSGLAGNLSLAVDQGVPYVSMNDTEYGNGLTVMRYTGRGATGWETVGQRNITGEYTHETSLFIDQGTPYVAYNATKYGAGGVILGTFVEVVKYADGVWSKVGDYTPEQGNDGGNNMSLYVEQGVPYAGYRSRGLGGEVIRFDGNNWHLLGGKNFTASESVVIRWSSLQVYNGVPYLGYSMDSGASLSKFNGERWEYVGSKGFYQPGVWITKLALNEQGTPYMLFGDEKHGGKTVVMKYTGRGESGWERVGNLFFSAGHAEYTSFAVSGGKIYAAFTDRGNDDKTTVMMFDEFAAAPAAPTGIKAVAAGDGALRVSWSKGEAAASYHVYRATNAAGPYVRLTSEPTDAESYSDSGLAAGTAYYYQVTALEGPYESAPTATVTARTAGGGSGPQPGSGVEPSEPAIQIPAQSEIRDGRLTVPATAAAGGSAVVALTERQWSDLWQTAKTGTIRIEAADSAGGSLDSLEVQLPIPLLEDAVNAGWTVEIASGSSVVALSLDKLAAQWPAGAQKLSVAIKTIPASDSLQGNGAIYSMELTVDGRSVSLPTGGQAAYVKLPFSIEGAKLPHQVVAYRLTNAGAVAAVRGSIYDQSSGLISFPLGESGKYSVAYASVLFRDLEKANWARTAIEALAARNIASGVAEAEFAPTAAVTRAQFVHLLMKVLNFNGEYDAAAFTDVKADAWYASSIGAAQRLGIVNGRSDGAFGVNDSVTREEMAVMIYRAAIASGTALADGQATEFADLNAVSGYAREAVEALSKAGFISGMGDGRIEPQSPVSRAQSAVILYKLLKLLNQVQS